MLLYVFFGVIIRDETEKDGKKRYIGTKYHGKWVLLERKTKAAKCVVYKTRAFITVKHQKTTYIVTVLLGPLK
jgi:hypothetical protein